MENLQPHIKCKRGEVAKYVLLPGSPERAKLISTFLDKPRKIAFNREFLTYSGKYNSIGVSVTSTGVGCPSAAIAVEELANIGGEVFIRVGTCGGLQKNMRTGDIVIPTRILSQDGTTREYVAPTFKVEPSPEVVKALSKAAENLGVNCVFGVNRTHDAFYEPTENFTKLSEIKDLVSSEMECSAVFVVSALRKLKAGAILTVNTPEPPEKVARNPEILYRLIDEEKVNERIKNSIKIALEAVTILEQKQV
jgi:uridine phosphorylase